jgi:hypothetical protein
MGGATLIAIAIAVFVMLVSAQVFRDWPIAALGDSGNESTAVSDGQAAGGSNPAPSAGARATVVATNSAGSKRRRARDGSHGATAPGAVAGLGADGGAETGGSGGEAGGRGGGSGPAGVPQGPSSSSPSGTSGGGGGSGGGGSGSGGGGGAAGGGKGSTSSPSGQVTATVNDTVSKVDEAALGGSLGDSGVTGTTEEVVNGVAGPESVVGKVVDEATETVGGLLGKP